MPIDIPDKDFGPWCKNLVDECQSSLNTRRQRGAIFRNMYLTGDEGGVPQTYRKTYAYIQTLGALLYSPVELRFNVSPYGPVGPRERAMGRAAAGELLRFMRQGRVDATLEDAVDWALVKGKTFVQLEWSRNGIEAHMVQPETMAVLRDDITSLDKQDAFVHSTWLTETRFADLVANHPKASELIRDVQKLTTDSQDRPDIGDNSRQVMIGGQLYPFRARGAQNAGQGRGLVNWLSGPMPELDARTMARLVRLDELWVWDRNRSDWATFQVVGDKVIEPTTQIRNLFAEGYRNGKGGRKASGGVSADDDPTNPLRGHHPFVEICPNPMPDYMWGWSEILNVAAIQVAINNRVDGINRLLRRQEDPSWLIAGVNTQANQLRAKLRRPGGWHVENAPGSGVKIEKMSPDLPVGLWESLHELETMFDAMAGFPPVMQGQGDSGVRAQNHAETLVRMASPRFKDRALIIERQVEEVGGLSLDLLRAHLPDELPYWVQEQQAGPFKGKELDALLYEPPAPNMVGLPYQMAHVGDRFKVSVDSHSSSPIFSKEALERALMLNQRGAIGPDALIRMTHPADEETLIAEWESKEAARAEFIRQNPWVLQKGKAGRPPGR